MASLSSTHQLQLMSAILIKMHWTTRLVYRWVGWLPTSLLKIIWRNLSESCLDYCPSHWLTFAFCLFRMSTKSIFLNIIKLLIFLFSARLRRALRPTPTVIAQPPQISNSEIELLLTVSRGESRGFHRPSFVKQRISEGIAQLTAESGLEISSLTTEVSI